ncbi:Crp/Fnr family transcriptional regulator [Flagellimonas allohymeniacidonis]|uniref:Crp/Fnr family transcriptional regulator n=1 Tax=Flagellimonas allohymeniacidonis TaxID=2517819 RepID=A0A4Q8QDB8_9FLAO|nr:Crp/Fnr family transcriptional regulator [Allomuricauda hymeniacidonis]TAI48385.1 Crp/Fnr family transcriptional regulator [Allomuricauda hymeniacidonis]
MNNYLLEYLAQFIDLTNDEINYIQQNGKVRAYKKGDILLRQGQDAKNTYLVLRGCIKSFYLENGDEYITEFYVENDLIVPTGYAQQSPSRYFLSCLEDAMVSSGTIEGANHFVKLFPRLSKVCMQISNDLIAKQRISFDEYRLFSPEMRYVKFIKGRPKLSNRIPQYMIANYLGIKPQSLSRIRRRLVIKDC